MYITFQKYFRALTIELCMNPIYEKMDMKQSIVLVIIIALLVTGLETLVLVHITRQLKKECKRSSLKSIGFCKSTGFSHGQNRTI
jgi:hypothetical protein